MISQACSLLPTPGSSMNAAWAAEHLVKMDAGGVELSFMDLLYVLPGWVLGSFFFSWFVTAFAIVASTVALLRWDTIHWPWSHFRCGCHTRLQPLWEPNSKAASSHELRAREEALQLKFEELMGEGEVDENEPWEQHAERLRRLTQGGFLELDSITCSDGMLDFFAGHRVMARQRTLHCSLGIRLTVHYNLFCGTLLALGSQEQGRWLRGAHKSGVLGCFMLTEVGAGVLSGLVVETTATWTWAGEEGEGYFDLHTPTPAAVKTWISQGLAADWGVVIAQLIVEGTNHGAHVFLLDMTSHGISRESMGAKTTFNALDNAHISFDHVKVPHDALLSKLCMVQPRFEDDAWRAEYTFSGSRPPSFLVIAQRLLSGRLCISDSAIAYLEGVLEATQRYTEERMVWVDKERKMPLASLPYMEKMLGTVRACVNVHKAFLLLLQQQFADVIESGLGEVPRALATSIAAAKVEAPECAIKSIGLLRRDVGAFGLMESSPFGSANDVLLCCRFAEGDSRVLQQMLVRDLIREHSRLGPALGLGWRVVKAWLAGAIHTSEKLSYLRDQQLLKLLWTLRRYAKQHLGKSKMQTETDAWLHAGDLVYDVAKIHAQQIIHSTVERHFGRSRDTELFCNMSATDCKLCHAY